MATYISQPVSQSVNLSQFENSWYKPGGVLKRALWYLCNSIFIKSKIPYPSSFKIMLLRLFGAKVGSNVLIKPNVSIKFPWFLEVGDFVWIGEGVWIDNLTHVKVGDNVCISQGAFILTGNHDYRLTTFDLILGPVFIEDGVWIGAKAIVCPGVSLATHSVVTVGSVMTKNADAFTIYSGNPAKSVRVRHIAR